MFRDEARIFVLAGKGGHGCASFRREKYVPKGGPDGGNGGRGGHVLLKADPQENTLLSLVRNPHKRAGNGVCGSGNNRAGATGDDLVVQVPVGTIVRDEESGLVLKDLAVPGEEVVVASGGRGGRGNCSFKSATHQTPRAFEEGEPGDQRTLRLELKLIADVGLLGLPNAGKSTLVSSVSAARPKVADYPFTTIHPHPGIVELPGFRRLVMMDIPGLIEGAHLGQGLGDRFLRHVERTRVLVHLVDISSPADINSPVESTTPVESASPVESTSPVDSISDREGTASAEEGHRVILEEIKAFGRDLDQKPRLTVYSKADLVPDPEARAKGLNAALGIDAYPVSAVTGLNMDRLLEDCWRLLNPVD